jgi:CBS-domain-containing membrane protein
MTGKGWLALASLLVGIVATAWGLSHGMWPVAIVGIVLVLVFWYFAFQWLTGANRPMGAQSAIKPAANAAWNMKDQLAAGADEAEKRD